MEKKSPNTAIECSVDQCENHCQSQNYCSLNTVRIATHESDPSVCQCVDCESFVKKSGSDMSATNMTGTDMNCRDGSCKDKRHDSHMGTQSNG